MTTAARTRLTPLIGVFVAIGLIGLAMAVPALTGWDVYVRSFPPLHAEWDPRAGLGTLPALVVGGLAAWCSVDLARRLSWRQVAAGGVRRWARVALQPRPRRRQGRHRPDPRHQVRVPAHCPGHHRPSGHPSGVRLADPVRRAARRHRERELAATRGGTSAGSTVVLRAARPARSGERPGCRHRGHADRGLHGRGRPHHLAVARGGDGRAPRRTVSRLRPGSDLAGRQRRRDVRRRRGLGDRGARRRGDPSQRARGRSWPGCCSATA